MIIKPDMAKYRETGMAVREHFRALTGDVEPLSIDEAFLDLSGVLETGRMLALELARLAQNVQDQEGITISVGLSHNKLLAKVASDLDKPDGFAVLGRAEAADFLADKPVKLIWGVGRPPSGCTIWGSPASGSCAVRLPARGYDPDVRALRRPPL